MNFAADPLGSISVPYLGTFSLPATDAELLKSLQPHEVHRWTLPRIKECEEYLRTLRSVHNAAAPIHVTLPVEVIIRIFLNIKLNSIRDIAIMHVCRTWRTILLNVPEFFANLLGVVKKIGRRKDGNGLLGMLLPLSGTRKLTVHEPNLADLARSLGILVPHLTRIRSLAVDLEVPDFIDFHQFLKSGAMPELEDLSVLSNAQNRHALADDLPNLVPWTEDDLPSLRRLDLISALFTQASAYPPLESLTLRHGVTDSTVHLYIPRIKSPTLFLNALSQCSRLRILNLFNTLPTQLAGWDAIDHAFVLHFPELRALYVYEDRQRSVSRFLSHITSPPTASLNLGSNDPMFSDLLPTPLRKLMRDSMTAFHFVPERSDISSPKSRGSH
ncbi:hypothetical protein GSI_15463 [Ganoderma sinense ZZ0214-1]|uniref:F-box domain-containing protein n=1 Tax=Ganoderma sinense ZZ0214-1 TaxID=1077348 RepID=A0A2G8RMN7_9APHY|nr:hypothetical protein GSI_15463 [Ganoderma sinense ZZ0214-1]